MPGVDFNLLRKEITIEQLLDLLKWRPQRQSGPQQYGACPVHKGSSQRDRSFSVNLDIGRYHCHKCQAHGNQLEFWAAVRRTFTKQ